MQICNVTPFQFTNTNIEKIKTISNSSGEPLISRVLKVSLYAIALLGTIAADLIALPFIGICRLITCLSEPTAPSPSIQPQGPALNNSPSLPAALPQIPHPVLPPLRQTSLATNIRQTMRSLYPMHLLAFPENPHPASDIEFLKDAIRRGLSSCSDKKLIDYFSKNGDLSNTNELWQPQPIAPGQWAAACAITYYLTFKRHDLSYTPQFIKDFLHKDRIDDSFNLLKKYREEEQSLIFELIYNNGLFLPLSNQNLDNDLYRVQQRTRRRPPASEHITHAVWVEAGDLGNRYRGFTRAFDLATKQLRE